MKKTFAKLDLKGETVWQQYAPMESGVYAADEDTKPHGAWGRDRFMPTNFAFLDDGGFLLADGYGSLYIHRYDKDGKWLSCFGGAGGGEGKFDTPHGIWIDDRAGREPRSSSATGPTTRCSTSRWTASTSKRSRAMALPANAETWKTCS